MSILDKKWMKYKIYNQSRRAIYDEIKKIHTDNDSFKLTDIFGVQPGWEHVVIGPIRMQPSFRKSREQMADILYEIKPDHHFFQLKKDLPREQGWKLTIKQLKNVAIENNIDLTSVPQNKKSIWEFLKKEIPDSDLFQEKDYRTELSEFLDSYHGTKYFDHKRREWILNRFESCFPNSLILQSLEGQFDLSSSFNSINFTKKMLLVFDIEKKHYQEISNKVLYEQGSKEAEESFKQLQNELGDDILIS